VKPLARMSGTEKYNKVPQVEVEADSEETKIPQVETIDLNKPTSYNKYTSADDVTAELDRIQQKEAVGYFSLYSLPISLGLFACPISLLGVSN
jgi:hypothetical protein